MSTIRMKSFDPEQSTLYATSGFPSVAQKIASDNDKTTTIYRRFDRLSARNLLLLQAELAELEAQQDKNDIEDAKRSRRSEDRIVTAGMNDWKEFVENAELRDQKGCFVHPREKEKLNLAREIRAKLREYHEALTLHKDLLNTTAPSKRTVQALRNWFFDNTLGTKGGENIAQLWGASETIFDDPYDLVALRVPADQDRLSEFIQEYLGGFFQTSASDGRTTYTSERAIAHFVAVFSTVLAAVLLFGAIISLYIVKNKHALLGMLSGWTVLFAACVGLLTNARRDQIFGATAAYAAVLVVFISGNLGNG